MVQDGFDVNLLEAHDLRAPAKVFACVRSHMIMRTSLPSELGSGAVALSMWLCGAKLALRLHKLLRAAGPSNSRFSPLEHIRDNDRAATVRYERDSGDESARRRTSKPSACRAAALPRQRGRHFLGRPAHHERGLLLSYGRH